MFKEFPREVGPPRKVVTDMKGWLTFINRYNGMKKAVYTSIYTFKNINEKKKPDYDSAIVDKLFFDFDDKSCNAYDECWDLHVHLVEENIKHIIIMSGRGYHLYIFTLSLNPNNPKSCIYNAQHHFIDKLNLIVDGQVIGNTAQLARVPNTYNLKGKKFCIPLTQEQFEKGDEFIKQLASKQNFVKNIMIGNNHFDLTKFDYQSERFSEKAIFDIDAFEDSCNADYAKNCPNCIKNILSQDKIGWKQRYLLILYFREMGYTVQEVYNILEECLSKSKFKHCIKDERQLQYLFGRQDLIFPKCSNIMNDGMCPGKCENYENVIYK